MTGSAKLKGDRAERELAALIADHLGVPARRLRGAGRKDDVGDVEVPGWPLVIQSANWADTAAAARVKPVQVESQRRNAGARWAASFVRFRGGAWRVVLTPEQFFELARDAYGQVSS